MEFNDLPFEMPSLETVRSTLTAPQFTRLMEHALCLACLDEDVPPAVIEDDPKVIEQYVVDAYINLWRNNALNDFPNVFPTTSRDVNTALLHPNSPYYGEMTSEIRARILNDIRPEFLGQPANLDKIADAAEAVMSEYLAAEWADQYSATLGDTPRRLSYTEEGTRRVLLHLASISRHENN